MTSVYFRAHDLEALQTNLHRVFVFYCNNDPVKKKGKAVATKSAVKLGVQEITQAPKSARKESQMLSMEGLLKFLYNYSVIDRFVRRKSLALILNGFPDFMDYSQFLRVLRLIAEEMYFDYPAINSTGKFKRMLEKLNLDNVLNVALI